MIVQTDVLIIGAGAAGLMAARQLAKAGKRVTVLEAGNRTGGRIHTINSNGFPEGTELGAEFIHGSLPVTLGLLNEAGIKYKTAVGDMWRYADGQFTKADQLFGDWETLNEKLKALKTDITLNQFLERYFATVGYAELRESVRGFAAGYDTADPDKASTFAFRDELQSEDDDHQYRVEGGYGALITYLEQEIIKAGGMIRLSSIVKQVEWQQGRVTAITAGDEQYTASKIIIALPLGVLQADRSAQAAVIFDPLMPREKEAAIRQLGIGAVIKLLLNFSDRFWEGQAVKQGADESVVSMSYLFSGEPIPTWWTQTPADSTLLTGWIGGPDAYALKGESDEDILKLALQSLSAIYKLSVEELQHKLQASRIVNWTARPFILGSYSYATVETKQAQAILNQPVDGTLFFAGEALYDGPAMGTVEAALTSGKNVAAAVLQELG